MNAGSTPRRSARGNKPKTGVPKSLPLIWWRSVPASDFHSSAIDVMRGTIANIEMLHEPRWRKAVAGDAASAFNLALSIDPTGLGQSKLNLAMTALVICAHEGNPTACVVVASVINRTKGIRAKEELAYSWALRASAMMADRTAIEAPD
ncbi:hypothetical protein QY049_28465 [Bradyrhizobium sp. WYCCWR 13022]|uniref:hypothetical protein n=1 Tax=unclassified Bradyrhizobium TaxID=2631580 RepID=UPI00263B46EB|nr:hypothetical protein [Bradyrhizobium sp. WYCCWR 13022]MDN4987102.1 hypothetical protein [Bradyrhizobium sp. WYCCWR 13022]